jgi:hypothetical protein
MKKLLVAALLLGVAGTGFAQEYFATWTIHKTIRFNCPDESSGIDPAGTPVIVTNTAKHCAGADCTQTSVSTLSVAYPANKVCEQHPTYKLYALLPSVELGEEAAAICKRDDYCADWKGGAVDATEAHNDVLAARGEGRIIGIPYDANVAKVNGQ